MKIDENVVRLQQLLQDSFVKIGSSSVLMMNIEGNAFLGMLYNMMNE